MQYFFALFEFIMLTVRIRAELLNDNETDSPEVFLNVEDETSHKNMSKMRFIFSKIGLIRNYFEFVRLTQLEKKPIWTPNRAISFFKLILKN